MKDDNFYVVKGWMLNDLNLKGNELVVYAIVYGFSQDSSSRFTGSLKYVESAIGASRPTVIKALKALVSAGHIKKVSTIKNSITYNEYYADLTGSKEPLPLTSKEALQGGSKETLPNSISKNNIVNKIEKKHKYGEYKNVLLTDTEYENLKEKLRDREKWITEVDEGIELKGYTYKSHYLAILKWAKKDGGYKVSADSTQQVKKRFNFETE